MIGLFLFFVVGLWILVSALISIFLARRLPWFPLRVTGAIALFAVLMVAPVADEIVGGMQFRKLCEKEAVLTIDADAVRGKTVRQVGSSHLLENTILEIRSLRVGLVDVATGNELGNYVFMRVKGGWFIRALHISEGNAPLLINPSECDPRPEAMLNDLYRFNLIH